MDQRDVVRRGLRILALAVREEPRVFAVSVVGSALFGAVTVGNAFVVGAVVGRVVVPAIDSGRTTVAALASAAAALFGVAVIKVVGVVARRLGAGVMQYRLQATYRRRVTRKYLELPLAWHQRHPTGALLSNANADVEAVWFPIAPFPFAVGVLVMLAVAVVALLLTDWVLALVGLALFPAVFALNVVYSRRMSPRMAHAQALRGQLSARAHESFDGALVVKTLGREAAEAARFTAEANQLRDAMVRVGRVRGLFDPLMEALPNLATAAVLLIGAFRARAGEVSVAEVVSVAFLFTVLAFPLRAIGWVLGDLPRSVVGWERVRRVLDATGEMPYGEARLPWQAGPVGLAVRSVSYAYPSPPTEHTTVGASTPDAPAGPPGGPPDGPPGGPPAGPPVPTLVLRDVTFDVPPGRTVALVGPTGAGKSTITALVSRLVDPVRGSLTLDGVDLRELAEGEVSRAVALVGQTAFLFDDTVAGNVSLGAAVSEDEIWEALRLAQADRFVAALPDRLHTRVGERGTSLSGGQRQRIALARALVRRPGLLVLDDATSSVDPVVEAAILRALRGPALGATVLVVAYRRATIALADEVVYLERGRVVARGTHAALLDSVPGYAHLVTAYEEAERERVREQAFQTVEAR